MLAEQRKIVSNFMYWTTKYPILKCLFISTNWFHSFFSPTLPNHSIDSPSQKRTCTTFHRTNNNSIWCLQNLSITYLMIVLASHIVLFSVCLSFGLACGEKKAHLSPEMPIFLWYASSLLVIALFIYLLIHLTMCFCVSFAPRFSFVDYFSSFYLFL